MQNGTSNSSSDSKGVMDNQFMSTILISIKTKKELLQTKTDSLYSAEWFSNIETTLSRPSTFLLPAQESSANN